MTAQATDYTLEVHPDGSITTTIQGATYQAKKVHGCTGCEFDEETEENARHFGRLKCTSAHDKALSDMESVVWVRAE